MATPDEILRRLNDELAAQNPRGMFVTLQVLVFDLKRREVSCASAGHHELVLLSPGAQPRRVFPASGRPAGLFPNNPVEAETLPLRPGDTFVLFSDGVPEALDVQDEFYGDDRLVDALQSAPLDSAAATVQRVLSSVREFAAGARQADDITVVAARYTPE
jgi:sigma-B regulation protein RsbU (phosphoserine phosphatase)